MQEIKHTVELSCTVMLVRTICREASDACVVTVLSKLLRVIREVNGTRTKASTWRASITCCNGDWRLCGCRSLSRRIGCGDCMHYQNSATEAMVS